MPTLVAVDLSATTRYYEAGFAESLVPPRAEPDLRELLDGTRLFVADEGDDILGYVSFYATGPYLHLEEIGVRREAQGRGVGTALLDFYVDHAPG
jgi:ribosomal protein S18 acetylase RimI-like enzyme